MIVKKLVRKDFDRSGDVDRKEIKAEFENYHQPLAQMEQGNFFDWGIVQGLQVKGDIGSLSLEIYPGVAIDDQGNLIALAESAADNRGQLSNNASVGEDKQAASVPATISTAGSEAKTALITIEADEFPGANDTWELRPWIRLQDASLFDAAAIRRMLILARVTIDDNGAITEVSGQHRKMLETSVGKILLMKADQSDADPSNVSQKATIILDGNSGEIHAGDNGQAGQLSIKNSQGTTTAQTDGATGDFRLRGGVLAGSLSVRDNADNITTHIDGATGNVGIGIEVLKRGCM